MSEKKTREKRYYYKAEVLRVIDGDTIDVSLDIGFEISLKKRLRLEGINTPESRTRNLSEKALGLKAKEFTQKFCARESVIVHTVKTGKFGRLLALVYVGDKCLNEELIKAGLAREYFGGKRKGWFDE